MAVNVDGLAQILSLLSTTRAETAIPNQNEAIGAAFQLLVDRFTHSMAKSLATEFASALAPTQAPTPIPEEPAATTPIQVEPEAPLSEQSVELVAKAKEPNKVHRTRSEAQKARWALSRAAGHGSHQVSSKTRQVSPEVKAKIAEAQRRNWAARRGEVVTEPIVIESAETEPVIILPEIEPVVLTPQIIEDSETIVDVVDDLEDEPIVADVHEHIPSDAKLVVKEGYTGDPFYITPDFHYVGTDGFIVPSSFEEFYDRYPQYIEKWVKHRLKGQGSKEDIEDWCQELIIHMKYLPPTSKHRDAGKTDVIQTFNPFAQYGANIRRWRSYINFCLANKYNTIHGKRSKNPVCRAGNISLVSEVNPEIHGEVTDEYVYSKSSFLSDATLREEERQEGKFFVNSFIEYVQSKDQDMFPIIEALYHSGNSSDTIKDFCQTCKRLATTVELSNGDHIGHDMGITTKELGKARSKLKQYGINFLKKGNRPTVNS